MHASDSVDGAAGLPAATPASSIQRAGQIFARLVEIPAALLVVAEILVLLAGILARYVFHKPIVWSDELAGILFLWLEMLGAVIDFPLGAHIASAATVGVVNPGARGPRRGRG